MQATWFSTQPTQNASEYMGAGALARAGMAKAQDAEYDIDQKRKLQQVFSKNMDSLGNLSELDFYKAVSSEGLDPQHAAMAMEWRKQQIAANEAEIQHRANSSMYGADTKAVGRNQATFGAPKPIAVTGTAQQQPQQDQDIFGGPAPKEPPVSTTKTEPTNNIPKTKQSSKNPLVAAAPPPPAPETQQAKDLGASTPVADVTSSDTIHGWFNTARAKAIADNQAQESMKQNLARFLGMQPKQEEQPAPVIPTDTQVAPANTVNITADNAAPSKAGEGKLPMPEIPTTDYRTPEDRRSAVQRYADSITDPTGMSNMPGQGVNGNGSRKYFQLDPNAPEQTKQAFATNLARNGALNVAPGQPASIADINEALVKQQDADYEAIGLPPGPQTNKEGKFDPVATRNALREYYNKFPAIYQKWVSTGGKEYADQLEQRIKIDTNTRASLQLNNDVKAKQAGFDGMNQFVAELSKAAKHIGKGGDLDPTTFASMDKVEEFNKRISAFNKLKGTPTTPLELLNAGKNFSVAEGLGEAEGTRNLFMQLASPDLRTRIQIHLANGGDASPTELVKVFGQELLQGKAVNLDKLKPHMAINGEVDAHRGTGKMPKLGEFDQGAEKKLPGVAVEPPPSPAKDDKGGDKGDAGDKKQPAKAQPKAAKVQPKAVKDIKKRSF